MMLFLKMAAKLYFCIYNKALFSNVFLRKYKPSNICYTLKER